MSTRGSYSPRKLGTIIDMAHIIIGYSFRDREQSWGGICRSLLIGHLVEIYVELWSGERD